MLSQLPHSFATPKLYLNFLFLVQFLPLFVFYSFDYIVKSGGVCNRLPVLNQHSTNILPIRHPVLGVYYTVPVSVNYAFIHLLTQLLTRSITPIITYTFMYLYHLISIDLESSRSVNSTHCKSLQLWARIALPVNGLPGLHYLLTDQLDCTYLLSN